MGILSASTLTELNNHTIDAGANFLVGGVTSSFDPNFSKEQAGLMSVAGSAIGVVSGAAAISANAIGSPSSVVNSIVSEGLTYISQKITAYIAEATVKMMTFPTSYIAEVTKVKIEEGMKNIPKEAVKAATTDVENINKQKEEEAKNEKENKIKNDMSNKIKNMSYTASQALNNAQDKLNSIATYVSKGPDWMNSQIEKYSDLVVCQTSGFLSKTVDSFEKTKMSFCYSLGETASNVVLGKAYQETLKATKDAADKINKTKQQAMSKAKAATAQALMKIKGLLGG